MDLDLDPGTWTWTSPSDGEQDRRERARRSTRLSGSSWPIHFGPAGSSRGRDPAPLTTARRDAVPRRGHDRGESTLRPPCSCARGPPNRRAPAQHPAQSRPPSRPPLPPLGPVRIRSASTPSRDIARGEARILRPPRRPARGYGTRCRRRRETDAIRDSGFRRSGNVSLARAGSRSDRADRNRVTETSPRSVRSVRSTRSIRAPTPRRFRPIKRAMIATAAVRGNQGPRPRRTPDIARR